MEMQKGNFDEALAHFEKTDLSNNPFNLQKMGMIYEQMGNSQMANKYLGKAKSTNQNGVGFALIRKSLRD